MNTRTTRSIHPSDRQRGLSIVELMVAMGLSLLLLAGVLVMFTSSKSTYEINDRIARVQENGRTALNFITEGSRSAGYAGCASQPPEGHPVVSILGTPAGMVGATLYGQDFAVTGYNYMAPNTWSPVLDTTGWSTGTIPQDGSDALLIMQPRRGVLPLELTTSMTSTTEDLQVTPIASGNGPFNVGQILMVASCTDRTYFQITGYDAVNGIIQHAQIAPDALHPGNVTNDLGHAFTGTDQPNSNMGYASVISLQSVLFYVRDGSVAGQKSLWRRVDGLAPEELIEGIDSMQLRYGVDTTADSVVDSYVTADAITVANRRNVISIQIALLARSVDEYGTIAADTRTYTLLDSSFVAPGDHRLRQIFTTTLTLRNSAK